jgi:hypothetical protein
MPKLQFAAVSPVTRVDARACPSCKAIMVLARIRPASLDFDLCTFDCTKCEKTERVTLKTASAMWRSSPLRAPD